MLYNPSTHHIEININKTLHQIPVCFYRGSMIAIFPISTFSILPLIELMSRPARNHLNQFRYDISVSIIPDQKIELEASYN
jgi:hypothetical protein